MVGSVGSSRGPGLVGIEINVSAKALAIQATCVGNGTLAVSYGTARTIPPYGQPGAMFPCAPDGTTGRIELPAGIGPGMLTLWSGIIASVSFTVPDQFAVEVEQAN